MKLFVKTKDKKYPIYFSVNSHINIKKILIKNNINPKKLMVVYDKNVPKNITNKFKHTLKEGENIFLGLNVSEKIKNLNTVKTILDILGKMAIAGIFNLKMFLISFLRLSKEYLKRPGISGIGSFLSVPSTINIG